MDIPERTEPMPCSSRARVRALLAVVSLTGVLALAGCGDRPAADTPSATAVTVENCGRSLTFDAVPERVVGYYQHPTELLVALGLRDRLVGTVYPDNDPLPRYAEEYRTIPVVSERDASFEQLLTLAPDLVYGGYGSAFDDQAGRSRETFADAGIDTYLSREECLDRAVTMADVYDEIRTVGQVFRVPDRAGALVEDLRATVAAAAGRAGSAEPLTVFAYDSGDATAYTSGGTGMGNEVIRLAGGTNVFADVDRDWADVSWEQVVARAPDVIVIYDYHATPPVEEKIRFLLGRADLADVPAIRNRRFATLTLQDTVLGVRAPYAVEALAAQLHPAR